MRFRSIILPFRQAYFFLLITGIIITICRTKNQAQNITDKQLFKLEHILADRDTGNINKLIQYAIYIYPQQPDTALQLFKKALNNSLQINFEHGIIRTFPSIAEEYDKKGLYKETALMLRRLISFCQEKKVYKIVPFIYNSMGISFQKQGLYDSASYYFDKAITAAQNVSDTLLIARLYINYSALLISMQQYKSALDYLDKAEQIVAKKYSPYYLTQVFLNRGGIYNKFEQWQKGEENLQKALILARRNKYRQWEFLALTSLGNNNYLQGKHNEAITLLEEALRIKNAVDPFYKTMAIKTLGLAYLEKGRLPQAIYYLDMALEQSKAMNIPKGIKECSEALSNIYTLQGRHKKALEYYKQYTQLKDSLENESVREKVSELEIKYQTAEKDKELAEKKLLLNEKDSSLRQKNNWIAGTSLGALLLSVLSILAFTLYRSSRNKRRLQEQTIKTMAKEQEIKNLKAIMQGEEKERKRIAQELHDGIGGMLSSLRMNIGLLQEEYPHITTSGTLQRISEQLTATAGEVRHTAHNLMPDILLRHNLKEALLHFCANLDQEKLKIDILYHVQEPPKKEIEIFLYRIIQELVQNVVKHAAANHAVIQIIQAGKDLNVTVEDNGCGFDTNRLYEGMGLENIRQRVENTGGTLHVNSKPGSGTIIQLLFVYDQLLKL